MKCIFSSMLICVLIHRILKNKTQHPENVKLTFKIKEFPHFQIWDLMLESEEPTLELPICARAKPFTFIFQTGAEVFRSACFIN